MKTDFREDSRNTNAEMFYDRMKLFRWSKAYFLSSFFFNTEFGSNNMAAEESEYN